MCWKQVPTHAFAHIWCTFPFVIHTHNCAFCGIYLHNNKKKRQKTIPTNAAKRTSPLTKIQPIHFFLLKQVNSKKHKMYTNLLVTCPQTTYLHEVIFGYFPIIVQIIDFKGDWVKNDKECQTKWFKSYLILYTLCYWMYNTCTLRQIKYKVMKTFKALNWQSLKKSYYNSSFRGLEPIATLYKMSNVTIPLVKTAYEPSGPSGRSLSWLQSHCKLENVVSLQWRFTDLIPKLAWPQSG